MTDTKPATTRTPGQAAFEAWHKAAQCPTTWELLSDRDRADWEDAADAACDEAVSAELAAIAVGQANLTAERDHLRALVAELLGYADRDTIPGVDIRADIHYRAGIEVAQRPATPVPYGPGTGIDDEGNEYEHDPSVLEQP